MKIQLLVPVLMTILSCSTKPDTQKSNQADSTTFDADTNAGLKDQKTSDTVLYKSESLHYFSSTTDKDSFKVTVMGQSIKDGRFKFQIITKDGQVILDESYETVMLLDYGLKDNATEDEIEDYVKERIDKFFNEDNFSQPAISKDDTFDEDYGEKGIWDDIIADQTSVGFYYLIGEEAGQRIAFSKRLGKVVTYYSCC